MKLFPKLALTISGLLAASILALCAAFFVAERRTIRAQASDERRALLQNLAHITREALISGDDLLLVKYTRWMQRWNPSIISLSVVSPQGKILAHSEPDHIGLNSETSETPQRDAVLVQSQSVPIGKRMGGTVSARFSEARIEEALLRQTDALQQRVLGIALAALLAGLMISSALAHSWAHPIAALCQAAQRIGQGHYGHALENEARRPDEIGLLARAFQTMSRDLARLDETKEDFVSAVTHELRSPLGAIESYLNLIQEEYQQGISSAAWPGYIERLRVNTQRLNRFINDLLDVAALERGKVEMVFQTFAPHELMADIAGFFVPRFSEKKLTLRISAPSAAGPAFGDPEKIRQVLTNLLANAIKFTPEGGVIEVGAERVEAGIRFFVRDSGIGIAPEDQPRLFQKFVQIRSARAAVKGPKGTGLGLALCRNIIAAHRSSLRVDSVPGQGSCFSFTLPESERECS